MSTSFVEQVAQARRQDSRDEATAETQAAKALERQRREKRRERNRLLWAEHFERLAVSLRDRAEDYEQRAEALLKGQPKGAH